MIPNIGQEAVKLSRLAANELEYKDFMKRRHNRLQYYNAETEDLTKKWFSPNLLKNVPIGNINITKRIVDRISGVYMIEAQRIFDNDKAAMRYKELTPNKHGRMQRAERMTNLLDVVAIHPFWDDNKKIIDQSTLLEFQPFFDKFGNFVGIRYPLVQDSNLNSTDEQTFVEWDLNGWRIVDVNGLEISAQPYEGPFPFVLSWAGGDEPEYFYDHNPTADLVQANLGINFFQTCLNGNIGFQSFGQPYVTGLQADQTIEWGIDKVPALPDGATAGMLSPPKTAADIVLVKKDLTISAAKSYHISDDLEGSAQPESGVALKARGQELQNERKGDVVRSRKVEREIYTIERYIASRIGVNLPEVMSVDFAESVEYFTAQEQREKDDWDLAHNLITVADIAMRNNPDLDEAKAEKLIMDNASKGGAVKKAESGRTNIVDDIFGA